MKPHFSLRSSRPAGRQLRLAGPAVSFIHLEELQETTAGRRQPGGHVSNGDCRETEKDV